MTVAGVCIAFLCVNILPPISKHINRNTIRTISQKSTNDSKIFKKEKLASCLDQNLKSQPNLVNSNDYSHLIDTPQFINKNHPNKKVLSVKHNLSRKSSVGFSALIKMLDSFIKTEHIQVTLNKQEAIKKLYVQVNYKVGKQNGLLLTARKNHKLEGLVFWNTLERFSIGAGLAVQRSSWSSFVGKKLTTQKFEKITDNNPNIMSEERDFFVDEDTIFLNNNTDQSSQESNESDYWNNNFYAKNGELVTKENTLWLLCAPLRLRYDILRTNEWVFRGAGTVIPQLMFNQKSVAIHNELNVWVEDNQAFEKVSVALEGSVEIEKKIKGKAVNIQLSFGYNPLKKQSIYMKEKGLESMNGSIGIGYLFGG